MVFFLAFRNITKNIKDSAVIALLIAVITFLFFIGNTVIGNTEKNMRRAFIESLTGDVVLEKSGDITMNLFGGNTPIIDNFFAIPVLPAYDTVMDIVSAETGIEGITSQVSGKAFLYIHNHNVWEPVLLCGIDAESYFSIFPGIILEEGRFLQTGEYGAMITEERARRIEEKSGQRPEIGISMFFVSAGAMGYKVREVPLIGIFRYQNPGQFMNEIVIVDPQTVRVLNSIQVAGTAGVTGTEKTDYDFLSADPDDFFSEAFVDGGGDDEVEFSPDLLQGILSESKPDTNRVETGGDWNFILLRLKKGISSDTFISHLIKKIEPFGVTAVNWRVASGNSAILTLLLQALFNSGIFLVSVVGVIAVINILLISVFRRVREIGTLRAIGAPDSYIRSLIYCENILIASAAGFAGIIGGMIFLRWVNNLDIHISNELIASLLDGTVLRIDVFPQMAVFSFFVAVLLGLAAGIYPVEAAVRIEPEMAVRRG